MKKMKKIAGLLLAMVMVLAMTASVFAAKITINTDESGSVFAAYKLLNATDGGGGKFAYTVNEKYSDILKSVTNATADAGIVAYISNLDDEGIRTFADAVYGQLGNLTADQTSSNNTFTSVAQGYYLIAETTVGTNTDGSTGSYSLVMLDTAGQTDITITAKEDTPTVEKKVKETNDSTGNTTGWQDAADYDIGDKVPFQLTGTVSAKIADYEKYYYEFHDTLSEGLTYDSSSITVKIDETDVTSSFDIVTEEKEETGETTLSVKCADIKNISDITLSNSSKIVVEYKATLNDKAVIGSAGNPNKVYLEYSNNPYDKGEPGTGTTPEDKVIVFTYKLVANKVDKDGSALNGAGFTLYKFNGTDNDYVQVGNEIKNVTTFTFTGIDAGQYKLVESTVPAGYNKAADLIFTVEATYDTDSAEPQLLTLVVKDASGNTISGPDDENATFSATLNSGEVETNIENLSGTELPSTGGIGTTIFYVIGTILVLGAAVLLVTKRRMNGQK